MKRHLLLAALLLPRLLAAASVDEGGWLVSGPPTPEETAALLTPPALSRSGGGQASTNALPLRLPPDLLPHVRELARGLVNDWESCFRFVRDNVAFEPYRGFLRGAERTLLDRAGSDADQALLLLELLRASGYENARLEHLPLVTDGNEPVSGLLLPFRNHDGAHPVNLASRLGLDAIDSSAAEQIRIASLYSTAGMPTVWKWMDGALYGAQARFWVRLSLPDGSVVDLDPSAKACAPAVRRDVRSDAGLSLAGLLAAVGGTTNETSVSGLSVPNLDDWLDARCADLRSAWGGDSTPCSDFIAPPRILVPSNPSDPPPGIMLGTPVPVDSLSGPDCDALRASVELTVGSAPAVSFFLDELGARMLSVRFDNSDPGGARAVVFLDDAPLVAEPALSPSSLRSYRIRVTHSRGTVTATGSLSAAPGAVHCLVAGFGPESGMGAASEADRTARLLSWMDSPSAPASAVHAVGSQWQMQRALAERAWNLAAGDARRTLFKLGFSGQSAAPYVDMPIGLTVVTGAMDRIPGPFFLESALEHAVLESFAGAPTSAVSTVRLLAVAAESGIPVHFASPSNADDVLPLLSGYAASPWADVTNRIAEGFSLLLPASGSLSLRDWRGAGFVGFGELPDGLWKTSMRISGGISGGFAAFPFDLANNHSIANNTSFVTSSLLFAGRDAGLPAFVVADPVSLPSGALLDGSEDLTLPDLVWSRTYDSRGRFSEGPLGRGWTHAFDASVSETTDPEAAFGDGSVAAAAPTLVAAAAINELLGPADALPAGETARRWTAAALVADWWTRRLVGGTAVVRLGPRAIRFTRREDGAFVPSPGVTASLSRTNGLFVLEARRGPVWRFDESGRLSSVEDRSGNDTALSRDGDGRLVRIADDFGFSFDFAWDGERVSSVSDSAGRTVRYAYDETGLLTNVVDASGAPWRYEYDAEGSLARKTDPLGNVLLRNAFDAFGRITNQTDAAGCERAFAYADGAAVRTLDSAGGRTVASFSAKGILLSRTDETGASSSFVPDSAGRLAETTNALGFATVFRRDARGDLVSVVESANGIPRETSLARDAEGRIAETTNALGHVTAFAYDGRDRPVLLRLPDGVSVSNDWTSSGRLAARTVLSSDGSVARRDEWTWGTNGLPAAHRVFGPGLPAVGAEETFAWTAAGLPSSRTDPLGGTSFFEYDAAGRLVRAIDPSGAETVLARDAAGRVVSSTDPLGRVTRFGWTPDGRLSFVRDPCGGVSTNVWDAFGRLVLAQDARGGVRSFEYDASGRLVRVADGLGTDTFVRDALGFVVAVTNALGDAITFERDPLGRPVLTVDPLGAETGIGYDLLDRPVSTVDPLGRLRSVTRDVLGRPLSFVRPSGAVETFAWDALGALAAVADAEGGAVTVARDAFGRTTAVTNACGEQVFSVARDAAGRPVSRTDGNGAVRTFAYDAVGRLLRSEGPSGTDEFAYDAAGGLLLASNAVVAESFVRDGCGRIVSASFDFPAGPTLAVALFRDADGLVTNALLPSGVSVVRVFDADGRPASVSAGPGRSWTFAHDAAGRLVSVAGPDGRADTLSFDAAGRVSGWSAGGFAGRAILRDAAGRRVRDAVTAGAVPAPVADRAFELAFDAAGRPVSGTLRLGAAAPLPLDFLHDGNGALTNLLAGGASVLSAARDDVGRPVSAQGEAFFRDACGAVVATERGGVRRLWIPDPDDPLGRPLVECDEFGSPLRTYVWSGSRLLGFLDATNGLVVAHCDEQGSVVALSDPSGILLHSAAYGPFGEDWGSSGDNPTPFAWLGSWGVRRVPGSDAVGPLYLTARRLYAPSLRRFLSLDPLGPAGGLTPYAYGDGNPLEWIDPFGLCPVHDPLGDMALGYENVTAENRIRTSGASQEVDEYLHEVGQVFAGYGDALWGVANGLYQTVRHPYQTVQNIGSAIESVIVDPLGTGQRLWDGFVSSFDDPRSFGQMFGGVLITAATVAAPHASSAGKVGQVGEVGSRIGETGTRVFRVYGGKSSPMGKSWTQIDPRTVPNYRKAAGLPPENSGRFLIEGVLDSSEGVIKRGALPIGNNPGGLQEFVVPSPDVHIKILNVQGLNPQF